MLGIGGAVGNTPGHTDSAVEELTQAPQAEVLGEIKVTGPKVTAWEDPDFKTIIEMESGPPPWESQTERPSDARNFLDCPKDWELRWINPKLLDQEGWRGWTPVRAKDPRVTIHVPSMISPEHQIRRGGHGGDLLAYMPRHWFLVRREQYRTRVKAQTQSSVDRMERLREETARGKFGVGSQIESAVHPAYTQGDGRTMTDP